MKIFLIGLPGCGKTTLGKAVAQLMDYAFVDLDEEVAKGERKSINEIFVAKGEEQFRHIEKTHLRSWCEKAEDYVMATGGGTPCFFSNMDEINNSGISVFLDTTVAEIAKRMMKTDLAKRPLFAAETAETIGVRIEAMRAQRLPYYKKARLIVSGEQINAQHIVKIVTELEG